MKRFFLLMILCVSAILSAQIQILEESPESITFRIINNNYSITDYDNYKRIIPGFSMEYDSDNFGAPELPYFNTKLSLPENGDYDVNILSRQNNTIKLDKQLIPIEIINSDDKGNYDYIYRIDEKKYNASKPLFQKGEPYIFRDYLLSDVSINLFSYDMDKKQLDVVEDIIVKITINGNVNRKKISSKYLPTKLLNASFATKIEKRKDSTRTVEMADFSKSQFWYSFEIYKDGIYKLSYDNLASKLPISDIDPRTIRIFSTGGAVLSRSVSSDGAPFVEIPLHIEGENDGSFDVQDYIIFYGQDRDGLDENEVYYYRRYLNPFSQGTKYWITFASNEFDSEPNRIPMESIYDEWDTVQTSHINVFRKESENVKRLSYEIRWFERSMISGSSEVINFYVSNLVENENAKVLVGLRQEYTSGYSNTHNVTVSVNGTPATIIWTGPNFNEKYIYTDALVNGTNTISITLNSSYRIFLDYVQVEYSQYLKKGNDFAEFFVSTNIEPEVRLFKLENDYSSDYKIYEVSAFNNVREVPYQNYDGKIGFTDDVATDFKIYVLDEDDYLSIEEIKEEHPVNIVDVDSPVYDFLVIYPEEFSSQSDKLIQLHKEYDGLNGQKFRLQDIFNQFNAGMPDPEAIRLFIKYYVTNINEDLQAVILMGSGTSDWRGFSSESVTKNKIPFYQKQIGYDDVSDDFYVRINNSSSGEYPIGRLAASNIEDMDWLLTRIERYLDNPNPGYWKNTLLLFADDNYHSSINNDIMHTTQIETASQVVEKEVSVDKIFAVEYPLNALRHKPEARDAMIERVNDGRLIWYYVGHGSARVLGDEKYFNAASDMGLLKNANKLPLFIAASCDVGEADNGSFNCLAEDLALYRNGGSIASIAATRKCSGPANTSMLNYFLDKAVNDRERVGFALMYAKATSSASSTNSEKFTIFGDPLLRISPPEALENITFDADFDSLQSRMTVTFTGEIPDNNIDGDVSLYAYDAEIDHQYLVPGTEIELNYTYEGTKMFSGISSVENGKFTGSFIVPDDVYGGNNAKIISYLYDEINHKDYVVFKKDLILSDVSISVDNDDSPQIEIFLEDENFVDGGQVSMNPELIVKISDSNGINLMNEPGHRIIALIDENSLPINLTQYFEYYKDSYTSGELRYSISSENIADEGRHSLTIIAYDSFNSPSVKTVNFVASKSATMTIKSVVAYPSPYTGNGNLKFSFVLSESADVRIDIYTMTGKKIQSLQEYALSNGYNEIGWNVRDRDGDKIANNTYFYKITAIGLDSKIKKEKIEKFVIYK